MKLGFWSSKGLSYFQTSLIHRPRPSSYISSVYQDFYHRKLKIWIESLNDSDDFFDVGKVSCLIKKGFRKFQVPSSNIKLRISETLKSRYVQTGSMRKFPLHNPITLSFQSIDGLCANTIFQYLFSRDSYLRFVILGYSAANPALSFFLSLLCPCCHLSRAEYSSSSPTYD